MSIFVKLSVDGSSGVDLMFSFVDGNSGVDLMFSFVEDDCGDGFVFDYRKYPNVPFPTYWMNTEQYRLDELTKAIGGMTWLVSANTFQNAMPNDYYYLDRDINALGTLGFFGATILKFFFGSIYLFANNVSPASDLCSNFTRGL